MVQYNNAIREGDTFFNAANVTNAATAIVTAATNTKGMFITSAWLLPGGANCTALIVSATAAPAAWNTAGNGIILAQVSSGTPTNVYGPPSMLPYPIFIPAGRGLYAITAAASGSTIVFASTRLIS